LGGPVAILRDTIGHSGSSPAGYHSNTHRGRYRAPSMGPRTARRGPRCAGLGRHRASEPVPPLNPCPPRQAYPGTALTRSSAASTTSIPIHFFRLLLVLPCLSLMAMTFLAPPCGGPVRCHLPRHGRGARAVLVATSMPLDRSLRARILVYPHVFSYCPPMSTALSVNFTASRRPFRPGRAWIESLIYTERSICCGRCADVLHLLSADHGHGIANEVFLAPCFRAS
jgi:hypothetical protein